jgi:hypothetical protein
MIEHDVTWWKVFELFKSALSSLRAERIRNRRAFFEDHISPAYKLLEQIHQDYLKNFGTLAEQLSSKEPQSLHSIAHWLQQQQAGLAPLRYGVMELSNQLDQSAFFEAVSCHRLKKDALIHETTLFLLNDIKAYFFSGDPWVSESWYSRFLEAIHLMARVPDIIIYPNNRDLGMGIFDARKEIQRLAFHLVRDELPVRFKTIGTNVAKLRGLCLT